MRDRPAQGARLNTDTCSQNAHRLSWFSRDLAEEPLPQGTKLGHAAAGAIRLTPIVFCSREPLPQRVSTARSPIKGPVERGQRGRVTRRNNLSNRSFNFTTQTPFDISHASTTAPTRTVRQNGRERLPSGR